MLRERIKQSLEEAPDTPEDRTAVTLRLVLTALEERDHCARIAGKEDGLDDEEIEALIDGMIQQRREEMERCGKKAWVELAEQEAAEIEILEGLLPPKMSAEDIDAAIDQTIRKLGASKLKHAGKVMAALKKRYKGQMDFALAKRHTCERLS